jgi:1,4-dihydroxy-2-naphthoate octaprenyltransferase
MATTAEWVEGARPRTLFLALAPVVAGTGVAAYDGHVRWTRVVLALVVALALQIGVNYANDYSDGVRGADAERVGPQRLVGSRAAAPQAVLGAAVGFFALGGAAGFALAALTTWWLLAVGIVCIAAAWAYTGTAKPYGYRGFGEIAVFVFFGLVAVGGTAYVQVGRITVVTVLAATPVGLLACAVLVANNLRDIPGDVHVGKRTLAVLVGDQRTRTLYVALTSLPFAISLAAVPYTGWSLLSLVAAPLAFNAQAPVRRGGTGRDLVPTLRETGMLTLAYAVLLAVALALPVW